MTSRAGSTITWYSYNKPNLINQGDNSSQFFYGADRSRYKQIAVTAAGGSLPAGTETTVYAGGIFEKVTKPSGVVEYQHYIMAGQEAVAIRTLRTNSANDTRYLPKDHLGSVDAITNESGSVVQRLSYDAFGKRRNATAWSGALGGGDWTNIAALTHRGFTFHEHLDNVDLVHMNGRVYDPNIGRFISADPFIQAPLMLQSLNRYSYVMNNPLSLIDPSGYSWLSKQLRSVGHFLEKNWKPIAAIAVGVVTYGAASGFFGGFNSALASASSMGVGEGVAVAGLTTGQAAVAGAAAGLTSGAIMGGAKGALIGGISGGAFAFGNAAWTGVGNGFVQGTGRALTAGAIGGGTAEALGGKFQDGFWFGFGASAASSIYQASTSHRATLRRGGMAHDKDPGLPGYQPANPAWDNVGVATPNAAAQTGRWWPFWYEGNAPLHALSRVPGFNSFAVLHDYWMNSISTGWLGTLSNFPSMPPAMLINYGALTDGLTPALLDNDP